MTKRSVMGFSMPWLVAAVSGAAGVLLVGLGVSAAGESEPASYVSITPCRAVDTRAAQPIGDKETPLAQEEVMVVPGHGVSGQCELSDDATGLMLNVTPVGPSAATFLTVWPTDDERPLASSLNPAPGQPPTPNAVATGLSADGTFSIYNRFGAVDVVVDVVGYYVPAVESASMAVVEELEQQIANLENSVATLSAVTEAQAAELEGLATTFAGVERLGDTLRFTEMNVQILNGADQTYNANGLGNLILGYNRDIGNDAERTGSHMLIVGDDHDYTAAGGAIFGRANTSSGWGASVLGGDDNTASGLRASVLGGAGNEASGDLSIVSGGHFNEASGLMTAVAAGRANEASGEYAAVSGGAGNQATGDRSVVSAGAFGTANNDYATVSGGGGNIATGSRAVVSGGANNTASGNYSTISGGKDNITSPLNEYNTVSGGDNLSCNIAGVGVCQEGPGVNAVD